MVSYIIGETLAKGIENRIPRNENEACGRLHNEKFLLCIVEINSIARANKSRKLRWAGYISRMKNERDDLKI